MVEGSDQLGGGRYALAQAIGGGAQAATHRAVDKRDGKLVVIKRFSVRGARSWKDVELAEREARVLKSISHPLLPKYIDHFEQAGSLYLVMDYIEGDNLQVLRERGIRFSEQEVWSFLADASSALDYLAQRTPPLIHRDIKPGNVIRQPSGAFALVDFGAVRDSLKPEGGSTVVGTYGYMAPEQFQGRAYPTSDVYATAATALYMLTGREPEELPHRGLAIDVGRVLHGVASRELVAVLTRCLEPDPDRRPARLAPLLTQRQRPANQQRARTDAPRSRPSQSSQRTGDPELWPLRPLLIVAVQIGLTLAQVALTLTLQAIVPFILTVISLFTSSRVRRAADAVRQAGEQAVAAVGHSRRRIVTELKSEHAPGAPGPRSQARAGPRVRVPRQRVGEETWPEAPAEEDFTAKEEKKAPPGHTKR